MGKKGLVGLAALCFLVAVGLVLKTLNGDGESDKETQETLLPRNFHKAIKPSGTFNITITRRDLSLGRLADLNDRGDQLFLTSKRGAKVREYLHMYGGREIHYRSIDQNLSLFLGPDGFLIPISKDPIVDLNQRVEFPFSSDLDAPEILPNMNLLVIKRKHNEKTKKDGYGIDQQTQSSITAQTVSDNQISDSIPIGNITSTIINNSSLWKGAGSGVVEGSSSPTITNIVEVYRSFNPITLLEKSDLDTLWVREHHGNNAISKDKLIRIDSGRSLGVKLPTGYSDVMRIANTGALVAATFGKVGGDQPIRAHLLIGEEWKELPIPGGYDFSFVQKVLFDGAMIGFITTSDGKKIRQVIWHGDECVVLNDLPYWPKQGLLSIIILANRRGEIYVRNVLNSQTNASEYYLLNVTVQR